MNRISNSFLNGVYAQLREKEVYNQGLFGFGITDGATPNAFNWGTDEGFFNKLGAGRLSSSDGGVVTYRWKRCYEIISRANYLLACMDLVDLSEEAKAKYSGETHFSTGAGLFCASGNLWWGTYYIDEHFHGRSS
ncbi:MAG: hypothetical protein L6V92_00120 [Phocaeicola vulgatus]|nr:MAG: hypothetical protein L6V92_00120 [Phocaeicola vulgatus]